MDDLGRCYYPAKLFPKLGIPLLVFKGLPILGPFRPLIKTIIKQIQRKNGNAKGIFPAQAMEFPVFFS